MISIMVVFNMKPVLVLFFCTNFLLFSLIADGLFADEKTAPRPTTGDREKKIEKKSTEKKVKKKRKKKKRRCRSYAKPRYRKMVRRWRQPPKIPKPRYREGYRDITFYAVNLGQRARLFPYLPDGTLDPEATKKVEHLFQDKETGGEHPIHPRLIKLLYKLADQLKARQINLISGFREATQNKSEGNHTRGLAVDFMIPGVALGAVARRARRLGHVGVGFYPVSGFVHLDVREGPSFFWIDRSGPGQPSCMRRMLPEAAAKSDRRWRPKHDEPKQHRNRKGKLLGAIEKPTEEHEEKTAETQGTRSDQGSHQRVTQE